MNKQEKNTIAGVVGLIKEAKYYLQENKPIQAYRNLEEMEKELTFGKVK